MKRAILLFCLVLIGFFAVLRINKNTNDISLLDADAVQSHSNENMFMVSLLIQNAGPPDRLVSVSSPSVQNVSILNPSGDDAAIVIPQNSTGILAMDGAHIMLVVPPDTFDQGTFLPLELTFENAGRVSTRVQNAGAAIMGHGLVNGISESPTPQIDLSWDIAPTSDGARVALETQDFTFVRAYDAAAHIPNQGHAHIYLNGLKLDRLYSETYEIGKLAAGKYSLSVTLNSNDHRPYLDQNGIITSALEFEIP